MKALKNIFARVFAVWAILVFIITMLLVFIPMLITGFWKEPTRTYMFINISRFWMKLFFHSHRCAQDLQRQRKF